MPFTLGQRWISDTESKLGLGTVVAVDVRMITLQFPATGENRLYAKHHSPITRVIFNPGDTINHYEGWQLKVTEIKQEEGIISYIGTRLDTGETNVVMPEVFLDSKLTFTQPKDRLFAGQIDRMEHFALRFRAHKYQSEQFYLPWSGLRGVRANLIPHQLHIAYEVGQRHAPRVLLADEVGLGKTIEAGMIIHQQLLTGRAERVLLVVPENLQHQWLVEMLRRFNLRFSLFDDQRYTEALQDSTNPFETEQWVICSLDFVQKNKQRLEQLASADWHLLVVDEAHHLSWDEKTPSPEHQAIEQLANNIAGVLLLTATPEQLGQQSHFARLRLLDPDRFHHYPTFIEEQQSYRAIADAVMALLNDEFLAEGTLNLVRQLINEQNIEPLLEEANSNDTNNKVARRKLITLLMDRHGTSRVLFRNTRNAIQGFPRRVLQPIKLPLPSQYQTAIKVSGIIGANKKLEDRVRDVLYPAQIYQELEGKNATWWSFDPRVEWLLNYLIAHRDKKVLIICAHTTTVLQLEQALRERGAIRAALFHQDQSLIDRDRAAAYFAAAEEGAQVLICSEIGSEGRNFQFSCRLVMFDLPFNPDLLEQRIGRLDRIGQNHDIQIMVPYLEKTPQAILLRWYHEGLDAFEHTCPTGRTLYDHCHQELMEYLITSAEGQKLDEFIDRCHQQHHHLRSKLEEGRDRLLEMHSNGGEQSQQLAATIAKQDNDVNLINFTINLLDIIGINQEDHSDNMMILTPSDHMLVPDFPDIPQDGCTVTFDRHQALSREDIQFISWEHPIIRNGLDMILSGHTGSSAVSLLKNKTLPVGTLLTELVYVVEAQAPKYLQLTRFLPPTPIRILMDAQGKDLADQVEFEQLNRQLKALNRHTARKLINSVQKEVHHMLQQAEKWAAQYAQGVITTAKDEADDKLSNELARLIALKKVNPSIRDEEIITLQNNREQVLAHLNQANYRLDAIRLIVVTH
ncbi:RNA Polymerase (RNAP)-binding ATPase and RNAP recycling factor [Candidatus Regiella insecticola LSR1]|uniref:RNA polymerase-associated protein RapA n=1 Tax=Candidatus Regiella insecticola LSR1 TaxID=663321 RepID=E0WTE5_9ENTR|nr:RNA polymerase-associated protein RapA [Candidatus Regiella insecticola]EFL91830.1 RNA Polymerase (RNAP)-binding ATPase and RNAP recycling factor [Candidatus Regiella insecticola LSR1]